MSPGSSACSPPATASFSSIRSPRPAGTCPRSSPAAARARATPVQLSTAYEVYLARNAAVLAAFDAIDSPNLFRVRPAEFLCAGLGSRPLHQQHRRPPALLRQQPPEQLRRRARRARDRRRHRGSPRRIGRARRRSSPSREPGRGQGRRSPFTLDAARTRTPPRIRRLMKPPLHQRRGASRKSAGAPALAARATQMRPEGPSSSLHTSDRIHAFSGKKPGEQCRGCGGGERPAGAGEHACARRRLCAHLRAHFGRQRAAARQRRAPPAVNPVAPLAVATTHITARDRIKQARLRATARLGLWSFCIRRRRLVSLPPNRSTGAGDENGQEGNAHVGPAAARALRRRSSPTP